jgi:RimJ/RimL family protein N-acetyltransferase
MKKAKKIQPVEAKHITLVPTLTEYGLIPAHQDLVADLHPYYEEWFYDPNMHEGFTKYEIILDWLNHPLSWTAWSNKDKKPFAFIIGRNVYGTTQVPKVIEWDIMSLPEYSKEAYLAMDEAINWIFKNTPVTRIESEIPLEICSTAIYKRLGFVSEGLKRDRHIFKGKSLDAEIMGLLKSDYKNPLSSSYKTRKETIELIEGRLDKVLTRV